ncbi:GspE/PulE family protein [Permianibacter aggregans]|uniref:General secretion pathway protein E n=1 Tax=Permianibacter aggregans TaxID=1510150 RepID=A0A4R6UG47_9GAMM|nr:GspE/PulE family protein [Permianibacter aggregans]QGX41180.1 type II/IV secretion system protein [Permianibacter aggregans]TDQ45780.1 general secretion pathway protein E [Permianibacter aggregans]
MAVVTGQSISTRPMMAIELLEMLHRKGMINEQQVQTAKLRIRSGSAEPAIAQVAKLNLKSLPPPHHVLSPEYLTEWVAGEFNVTYFRLDPLKINVDAVTAVMSLAFAQRHKILCVEVGANHVVVATAEPHFADWIPTLQHTIRKEIRLVLANPLAIHRYQTEFYHLSRSVKGASVEGSDSKVGNFEQLVDLSRAGEVDANDQHIVRIVDWLLQFAFDQRASDIHMEPRREKAIVRFRIDGVLQKVYEMPSAIGQAVLARFKILGRMDVAEKRKPQDGRIKSRTPDGLEVELRLSALPTAFGEKLVARIFDPNVLVKKFADLGLERQTEKKWLQLISNSTGIVLVTGPTGSGKTTTLYTSLKHLATPEVNVCSVEDPIEMVEPAFNQMQVNHDIDVTFATGVRALLRQDPDIIMIGEIRDLETAEMAIQASLTGHLVLSTLHTNDAASAVTRLIDIGVPPYMINATVLGVMAQRLVRILCPHCKVEAKPDSKKWKELVHPFDLPIPDVIYVPKGCHECRDTGYLGRQGIYEMLMMTPSIQKLVHPNCDVAPIRNQALKEGMHLLRISGAYKVAGGATTIEEVLRVAPPLEQLG